MNKKVIGFGLMVSTACLAANDASNIEDVMSHYFQLLTRFSHLQKRGAEQGMDDSLILELKTCESAIIACEQEIETLQRALDLEYNGAVRMPNHSVDEQHAFQETVPDYFSNTDLIDDSHIITAKPSWFKKHMQLVLLWCAEIAINIEDGYTAMKKKLAVLMAMIRRALR